MYKSVHALEIQWAKLQAAYRAARDELDGYQNGLARQYGASAYAKRFELRKFELLKLRETRAWKACLAWLDLNSPRDWNSTVPLHYACAVLSFHDAMTNGPLTTVPPLAYGRTRHAEEWLAHA